MKKGIITILLVSILFITPLSAQVTGNSQLPAREFSLNEENDFREILSGNSSGNTLQKKEAIIIPLYTEQLNYELSTAFTSALEMKLRKADVFILKKIKTNDFIFSDFTALYERMKNSAREIAKMNSVESVITGYIYSTGGMNKLKVYLINTVSDELVATYQDNIADKEDIPQVSSRCAVEFSSRIMSISASRYFFGSLFMPGLGQVMQKKYIRGAVFSAGFVYLFLKAVSLKVPYVTNDRFSERKVMTTEGLVTKYYINSTEYAYNEWLKLKSDQGYYLTNKNDILQERRNYAIAAAAVYLVNIFDIVRSIKSLNNRRELEKKLSINGWSDPEKAELRLTYRF